jgi:DNA-binding NtrC family response regulator
MSARLAILVVDDEPILLLAIKRELRLKFGSSYIYETAISAEDGLAAIDRLEKDGEELVLAISDWLMPGMKGDEFLKIVHETCPQVKLVMLSGHADASQMEALSGEAELFAFLSKPYQSSQLFDIVHRALEP